MKKLILLAAAATLSLHSIAQDKFVTSALTDLKEGNLDEAKSDIDKAIANPETKEKPKALFAKAQIYFQLQMKGGEKYASAGLYRDAAQALYKLVEVKPDYEKASVDQLLMVSAYYYFNDGVKAYNAKSYTESADLMKNVVKIYEMKNNKRFESVPDMRKVDTIAAEAYQTLANSSYYSGKYEEAIPMLIKVKNNPITKTPTAYECLIDAYNKQKNTAEAYAAISEARKAFPDDMTIRHDEINYFIMTGKQDELIKKLEEAATKEPNNADILFNIATTYLGMASPGKDGKKPANEAELTAKAEDAFQRALKVNPDNAGFNYNFGALYYNQATDYNNQMNAITGSSAADLKKYDDLKAKRDALFAKSVPYFEKSYTLLSPTESSLKNEDLYTYKSTLLALKEVYARQDKKDKVADMKKKYDAMK